MTGSSVGYVSGSNWSGSMNWAYALPFGFGTPTDTKLGHYERVNETYYIQAPSVGGTNVGSTKIRLEDSQLA